MYQIIMIEKLRKLNIASDVKSLELTGTFGIIIYLSVNYLIDNRILNDLSTHDSYSVSVGMLLNAIVIMITNCNKQ